MDVHYRRYFTSDLKPNPVTYFLGKSLGLLEPFFQSGAVEENAGIPIETADFNF